MRRTDLADGHGSVQKSCVGLEEEEKRWPGSREGREMLVAQDRDRVIHEIGWQARNGRTGGPWWGPGGELRLGWEQKGVKEEEKRRP